MLNEIKRQYWFLTFIGFCRNQWVKVLSGLAFLYITTLIIMPLAEPADSEFHSIVRATYWFIVTISTVGFGDILPTSTVGTIWTIFLICTGLSLFVSGLAVGGAIFYERRRQKMEGRIPLKGLANHTIIAEYRGEETRELIIELQSDPQWGNIVLNRDEDGEPNILSPDIVLLASFEPGFNNPLHDLGVKLYNANPDDKDSYPHICLQTAAQVIVHGKTDRDTFFIAHKILAFNPHVDVTVWVNDKKNIQDFKDLDKITPGKIYIMHSLRTEMFAQNIQDEAYMVFEALATNRRDAEFCKYTTPKKGDVYTAGDLEAFFKTQAKGKLIAILSPYGVFTTNPDDNLTVSPFSKAWFMVDDRVLIDWDKFEV